ncbi:MAG: iodotyrosine deiodinase [Sphingobacteriales bacterium]|jgi:iodotyrosine deiodinase
MNKEHLFIEYNPPRYTDEELAKKSSSFFHQMDSRRTIRDFSDKPVPKEVLENIIKTASTAPSGAHKQPWTFCIVTNPELKNQIRAAAEKEEFESYNGRMTKEWLEDLAPLGTDWKKPFLEIAPALIIIFKKAYDFVGTEKKKNYYVNESVGLAAGFLLTAIHQSGLCSLTHTPSPMDFLTKLLGRPANERPFLLIPIGYPADKTMVPDIHRKNLKDVSIWFE